MMPDDGLPRRSHVRFGAFALAAVGLVVFYGERRRAPSPVASPALLEERARTKPLSTSHSPAASSCAACEAAADAALSFAFVDGWSWADGGGEADALSRFARAYASSLQRTRRPAAAATPDASEAASDAILARELAYALALEEGAPSSAGAVCGRIGACGVSSSKLARLDAEAAPRPNVVVSKAHASRDDYGLVRVTRTADASDDSTFAWADYDEQFRYRWTQLRVATGLVATDGGAATVDLGNDESMTIAVPAAGAGAVGVLLSDPCYASTYVMCALGAAFDTGERTPALLNALLEGPAQAPGEAASYWAMMGDDLYDRDGDLTSSWWNSLSSTAQSRLFLTTAGNHDLWIDGNPGDATQGDQYGNGFVQFYGQDTVAALADAAQPFDFSVDPDAAFATFPARAEAALADPSNTIWWNQIGNVGFAGFSSAYALNETARYFTEACDWARGAYAAGTLDLFVIAGHWSQFGDGAPANTPTPHVHKLAAAGAFGDSCSRLAADDRLKFVEGHTHCNAVVSEGRGWMVAAQGMSGCGAYAITVLDTRDDAALLLNFPIANVDGMDNYDALLDCFSTRGARACADYADVWLNQSLARR